MKHIKKNLLLFFFASVLVGNNVFAMDRQDDKQGDKIVLPSNITNTSNNKYIGNNQLRSLVIPSNITRIDRNSFKRCSGLSEIVIQNGLQQVDEFSFAGCSSLREIQFPSTIKSIKSNSFSNNPNLTSISFANGTSGCVVKKGAFSNGNLKKIVHYGGVTFEEGKYNDITEDKSFNTECGFVELEKLTIYDGVTEIPDGECCGCTEFTSLVVPTTVTKIGDMSFMGCENLEEVYLPDGVQVIGESAFEGCFNLKYISMSNTLWCIENKAFKRCSNLEYIHIPASICSIGSNVFSGCKRLVELNIPQRNTGCLIGNNALKGCTSLTSLVIPSSVVGIENIFGNNHNNINPELNVLINDYRGGNTDYVRNNIINSGIPADSVEDASENNLKLEVIENNDGEYDSSEVKVLNVYTDTVPNRSFCDMVSARIITFENVNSIGYNALVNPFYGVEDCGPVEIILPDSLTSIGAGSIRGWQNLRFVSLGENITEIGDNVFGSCDNLRIIEVRASNEGRFVNVRDLLVSAGVLENKIRWHKK